MIDNILLEKYLRQAASTIQGSVMKDGDFYFRCPICGDSQKNKSIKRGHLKYHNNGMESFWFYRCFNGDCSANSSWSAENFLKNQFPMIHKTYVRDLIRNKKSGSDVEEIKRLNKVIQKQNEEKLKEQEKKKLTEEHKDTKFFVPINSDKHHLCEKAREVCESRKIPKSRSDRFFVATDGKYKNRLVIPFYDSKNQIYYYQCRDLVGNPVKYLNRTTNKDNAIYNIDNLDESKPVCVLEGPIDSMFIENSIATMGVGITNVMEKKLDSLDCYYILDNDEAGSVFAKKLLMKGKKVFLWMDFMKFYRLPKEIKDINDLYLYQNKEVLYTWSDFAKYFTNNFYDKIKL